MIFSSISSYTVTEIAWAKRLIGWLDLGVWWPPLSPQPFCLFVCLFVCLLDCLFVVFLCWYFDCFCILHLFHVKMAKQSYHPFAERHLCRLNLSTFCQVFHGSHHVSFFSFKKNYCIDCVTLTFVNGRKGTRTDHLDRMTWRLEFPMRNIVNMTLKKEITTLTNLWLN